MRALFLKWSPWPQSPFWCLISPTLHTPCVCFKSLPPPAPQWGFRDYTTALLSTVLLFWEEVIAYSARLVPFSSFLMGFLRWCQVQWCIGRVGGEERTQINIVNTENQGYLRCIITVNISSIFPFWAQVISSVKFCQTLWFSWKVRGLVLSHMLGCWSPHVSLRIDTGVCVEWSESCQKESPPAWGHVCSQLSTATFIPGAQALAEALPWATPGPFALKCHIIQTVMMASRVHWGPSSPSRHYKTTVFSH